jgi:hypothetical protein
VVPVAWPAGRPSPTAADVASGFVALPVSAVLSAQEKLKVGVGDLCCSCGGCPLVPCCLAYLCASL